MTYSGTKTDYGYVIHALNSMSKEEIKDNLSYLDVVDECTGEVVSKVQFISKSSRPLCAVYVREDAVFLVDPESLNVIIAAKINRDTGGWTVDVLPANYQQSTVIMITSKLLKVCS